MPARYRAALALTSLLLGAAPACAAPKAHHHARAAAALRAVDAPELLYSRRALRRTRTILQLKLLELREAGLERVRRAIERHVPIDELLKQP